MKAPQSLSGRGLAGASNARNFLRERPGVGDGDRVRALQRPVHAHPETVQRLPVRPQHQGKYYFDEYVCMYPLKFMYVCMYVCILTRLAYRYIFMLTEYRRSHQCDQDLVVYVCMYVCMYVICA